MNAALEKFEMPITNISFHRKKHLDNLRYLDAIEIDNIVSRSYFLQYFKYISENLDTLNFVPKDDTSNYNYRLVLFLLAVKDDAENKIRNFASGGIFKRLDSDDAFLLKRISSNRDFLFENQKFNIHILIDLKKKVVIQLLRFEVYKKFSEQLLNNK